MRIVLTDLDGTLLHSQTYSFEPATPAIDAIRQQEIPLILCTSKTRSEVELWRARLDNHHPFIVENGGAIYVPRGYFPFSLVRLFPREKVRSRGDYEVIEFGVPYRDLVLTLHAAAEESGCPVLGFDDMSIADIASRTLLPMGQAELSKKREYDEPFEVLGLGTHKLLQAIEERGRCWTRGDRFYHIMGQNSKASAARSLTRLYRKAFGNVTSVGIGDGDNDAEFLATVDSPILVRSRFTEALKIAVPRSVVTKAPGPHGWNEAVLRVLST